MMNRRGFLKVSAGGALLPAAIQFIGIDRAADVLIGPDREPLLLTSGNDWQWLDVSSSNQHVLTWMEVPTPGNDLLNNGLFIYAFAMGSDTSVRHVQLQPGQELIIGDNDAVAWVVERRSGILHTSVLVKRGQKLWAP